MTSIAELGIRVDSADAAKAADDLDKMTEAGKRSEDSVKRTGKAWEQAIGGMATNTQQIAKELQTLNAKQDSTAKLMADIGRSISAASSSFQSAAASMGNYRAQSEAVNSVQGKIAQSSEKTGKAAAGIAAGFDKAAAAANGLSSAEGKLSESTDAALARLTAMAKSSLDTSEYYQRVTASISSNTSALEAAKSSGTDYAAMQKRFKAESDALAGATDRSTESSKKSSAATEEQARDLADLLGKIDPTVSALKKLDAAQDQLSKFNASGILPDGEFVKYTAKLDQARQRLGTFDDSLQKTGVSSAQTSAALRQLPAQFTDIFTSLAGGQAPMTVLIQQGGQIKDTFGGIGPAAKAMGGYVAGLVNPFTLAAAAAVGLGVAYYKGSEESTRFKAALILTGNAAGTSAGNLAAMASKVSETVGTTGAAADALTQLASSGKVASGSFEEVAIAALSMEKATGKAVADTIAEFVKIGKDPVAAAKELNDQYGFLTASVYAQIVSLKEQGREQEAVKLLTDTYADTVQGRSKQVIENLSLWERAWNGVAGAASQALDGLKNVGREQSYADQIEALKGKLTGTAAFDVGGLRVNPGAVSKRDRDDIQGQINFLELQRDADQARTKFLADQSRANKESTAGIDLISKEADAAATSVDKLNKRLAALDKARSDNIATNSWGSGEQAKYEKAAAALKKQIADDQKKVTKTAASAVDLSGFNDAQNRLKLITGEYQNAQQKLNAAQKSGLLSQKDYSEQSAALVEQEKGRVTAAYQDEISALEQAKGRKSTSAEQRIALDQKIADARTNMVKAQKDADTQLEILATNEKGRIDKQTAAVQTYAKALDDQLAATKRQLELSVAGSGMGDEARRRLQEDIKIQQEYQDKLDKLLDQKNAKQIDDSVYERETELVRNALARRLDLQKDYYGAVEAEQTNWANGASSAYATYLEQVKDVAGQTKSAFTSAFKGIEDVFVDFISTGKASFKDFANSVLADLARIVVKQQIMAPLLKAMSDGTSSGGIGQASGEMFGGGTGSGFTDALSISQKAIGLYNTGAGQAFASGFESGTGFVGGVESGISAGYASLSGTLTGNTAAIGSMQAGYTGSAMSSWVAGQSGSAASGAATGAASGASAGISTLGAVGYGIGGAIQGYQAAGLKGAATGAAGAVGGAYGGAALGTMILPGIGTLIGAALGALLGGSVGASIWGGDWQTKDQGLQLGVEGGELDANQFEYQKKKGGLFGKNKKRTRISALDPEMQATLDNTYDATISGVGTLFERLNVQLNEGVLDGLNIDAIQISTKDKTSEEIQKELNGFFGAVAHEAVFAISEATSAGLSGFTFDGLTDFVNNLYGVNDVIKHLNVGLFDMSVTGGFMAEQLSLWAGGFEALRTSAATYYENFFTDAEKSTNALADVRKEFENLGIALPESRQGYRDMVEGIDRTTEAGRAMFATLISLSGDAAQAFTIIEANADAATTAAKTLADNLAETLNSAVTGASGAVQRAVNAEKDAATKAYNDRMTSLNDMSATAQKSVSDLTGVSNSLENALKSLRGTSDDTVKMLRSQAQATLESALATVRAGGSLAGFAGLEDALSTVSSSNNTDLYSSMEDFARDQGRTANVVAELNAVNGKQLTSAEQLLESVKEQIKQEKDQFDLQIEKFDLQLELAQGQIDALNGIDSSVISVAAAMSGLSTAITAALAARPAGSAASNTSANNSTLLDAVYQSVLGRDADKEGAAYWGGLLQSGAIDYAGLVDAITKDAKANGELKKYATGGLITGPGTGTSDSVLARLSAGEYVLRADAVRAYGTDLLDQMNAGNLPTLAGGGAQVRNYNASQTAATLNGSGDSGATNAELRRQLAEIYSGLAIMNKHMEKTAYNTTEMNQSGVQVINTVKTEAA